jgi:hypothetical protein
MNAQIDAKQAFNQIALPVIIASKIGSANTIRARTKVRE